MTTTMHVRHAIKFVEETSSVSVETLHVQSVRVEDTFAIAKIHNGD